MNQQNQPLELLLAHGEGEIGRVLVSGFPRIPGSTPAERLEWLNSNNTPLKRFLSLEPRGYAQMSTNIIAPPLNPDADAAFFVMQGERVYAMSGSNTICVATALLEAGHIKIQEGETKLLLETAVGIIPVTANTKNGKCLSVKLGVNGAFAHTLDLPLDVSGLGAVNVDIAFGGVFFVIVNARDLGIKLSPQTAREITAAAKPVLHAAREAVQPEHPEIKSIRGVAYALFTDTLADGALLNANVMPPGRLDRSPCGTGTAARLACAAARGELKAGDSLAAASVIGSRIRVECLEVSREEHPRVRLEITGRGRYYGRQTLFPPQPRNDDSPPEEFVLSDTWGEDLDSLAS
ncbi:MAG: proline racemase family protein [Alphaproteobacteria bacterium]|nr:proline racemase family protein [Alphaproteobacteria bacterium]